MPRRTDIESICVIGSGPIVIGQACEFDYAGCQALKVLREEGFRTIVVNSNPATIMTDPGFADRTYIEPLDLEGVASVLARERPDALLPTLGGQTALNLAVALAEDGVLDDLGVELIGAPVEVIRRAEDRELFRDAVRACGLEVPASRIVTSLAQLDGIPVPAVVRPAFTLGGHGGGFAVSQGELDTRRMEAQQADADPAGGDCLAIVAPAHLRPGFRMHVDDGRIGDIDDLLVTVAPVNRPLDVLEAREALVECMSLPQVLAYRRVRIVCEWVGCIHRQRMVREDTFKIPQLREFGDGVPALSAVHHGDFRLAQRCNQLLEPVLVSRDGMRRHDRGQPSARFMRMKRLSLRRRR